MNRQWALNSILVEHLGQDPKKGFEFEVLVRLKEAVNIPHEPGGYNNAISESHHFPILVGEQPVDIIVSYVRIYCVYHYNPCIVYQLGAHIIFQDVGFYFLQV